MIWITGLANSGKTTLAKSIEKELRKKFDNIVHLDGDEIRKVFNDNSYTSSSRKKLAYCYSKLCKVLSDQGLTVIMSTISMFDEVREWNRKNNKKYFEVYIKSTIKERLERDDKKIYKKKNIVTFNSKYQEPKNPNFIYEKKNKKKLLDILFNKFLKDE